MLNTKQDTAKNSTSSEVLKNRWLSAHWAYKDCWVKSHPGMASD